MEPETSPFTPGQPVPIEFFVGRTAEIERLRSLVGASTKGRFKIAFVVGEYGIGKSSLVSFVRHLSEREDSIAGTHVFLGGANGLQDMVRRTFDRILKESVEKPWHDQVRSFFGGHIKKVGLFGASIEFSVTQEDLAGLVGDFVPSLRKFLSQLRGQRKALLLILDDIDGLAESQEFANWLKSMVDQIATEEVPFHVCMLIVGLEDKRRSLIKLQPSLARIFDVFHVQPWADEETRRFYVDAFQKAAGIKISEEALSHMVRFTGGLPVVAHEIGNAVWRITSRPTVTIHDAIEGTLGAAEIIGLKFVEPQILHAIRSKKYRSILLKLGDNLDISFRRTDLLKNLEPQQIRVLDNFLRRMKSLGAIMRDGEVGLGEYRFANHLYCLYFWLEYRRQSEDESR
jgi:AAA ATPase-like protein